jgi:MSHA biogenesis protein MshG
MFFDYKGRDPQGALVEGQLEAENMDDALKQLEVQGIIPILLDVAAQKSTGINIDLSFLFVKKIKSDDLILFSRQMYSLSKAGIPLIRAFVGLADSYENPILVKTLRGIADGLQQGNDLATSMSAYPHVFSGIYLNMIRVGETTGRLDLAFKQLVGHLELEKTTKRRIKQATRYPITVLAAIGIAIIVINIFVVPNFKSIFDKFGADLPLPTVILITTSDFMINYWWLMLVIMVSLIGSWIYYIRTPEGEYFKDKLKFNLPLIGGLIQKITLSRFTRPFAMMMDAGVPILQALSISSNTVGNVYVGKAIAGMQEYIEQGESLTRAAASTEMFSPILLQMLSVGEETGTVGTMLKEISDFYDEEVDYGLETLSERLEPIILFIIACMVMILATGVFLPMWDLVDVVK